MIKHLVFWKLKKDAEGVSAEENAKKLNILFKNLEGKIPGLLTIEAGSNFNSSDAAWDYALYTSFQTKEDLHIYQVHPEHVQVGEFLKKVVSDRSVVDFEIG